MSAETLNDYELEAANAAKKIFFVKDGGLETSDAPEALKALAAANAFTGETGAVLAAWAMKAMFSLLPPPRKNCRKAIMSLRRRWTLSAPISVCSAG